MKLKLEMSRLQHRSFPASTSIHEESAASGVTGHELQMIDATTLALQSQLSASSSANNIHELWTAEETRYIIRWSYCHLTIGLWQMIATLQEQLWYMNRYWQVLSQSHSWQNTRKQNDTECSPQQQHLQQSRTTQMPIFYLDWRKYVSCWYSVFDCICSIFVCWWCVHILVCTYFLRLIPLSSATAAAIHETLIQFLCDIGLTENVLKEQLIGFCSDCASSMVGSIVVLPLCWRVNTSLATNFCLDRSEGRQLATQIVSYRSEDYVRSGCVYMLTANCSDFTTAWSCARAHVRPSLLFEPAHTDVVDFLTADTTEFSDFTTVRFLGKTDHLPNVCIKIQTPLQKKFAQRNIGSDRWVGDSWEFTDTLTFDLVQGHISEEGRSLSENPVQFC